MADPDPETLRMAARLARMRAKPPRTVDERDGLERLGAERALERLAADLEATAHHLEAFSKKRRKTPGSQ
ncbi:MULTISPECIES: hypothetical protein [unclassified Sphingomonas]|uniref:hypothetical protein n=1 Tax=unclassified Sphingomonas TaxID=196159 RepID=UPI00226A6947|nr:MULTISPECIES: hypothetical protein [unclassified Sphingomonas]